MRVHTKGNLRRTERQPRLERLALSWADDSGNPSMAWGRCCDLSPDGMRVEVSDKLPVRAYVNFRSEDGKITGSGSVRYCVRTKMKNIVGLEFTGSTRLMDHRV
jgi:hypothetical protein